MTQKQGILIEKHSVAELFKKLNDIHAQVILTNGRVTNLENKSIGLWISNHPYKFVTIIITILSITTPIVISDFRKPLLAWIFG